MQGIIQHGRLKTLEPSKEVSHDFVQSCTLKHSQYIQIVSHVQFTTSYPGSYLGFNIKVLNNCVFQNGSLVLGLWT